MRVTTSHRRPLVYDHAIAAMAFVFLLTVVAQAQRTQPLWYYPGINMSGAESGDFSELKDKRRVYVSFFHGSTPAAYQRTLEQQVFQELKQYEGLEVVNSPGMAELAIHISVTGIYSPAVARMPSMPATEGPEPVKRHDITFYVLTRGMKRGEGVSNPRVIVRRQRMETESSSSVVVLEVSSLIEGLKRLRGEK